MRSFLSRLSCFSTRTIEENAELHTLNTVSQESISEHVVETTNSFESLQSNFKEDFLTSSEIKKCIGQLCKQNPFFILDLINELHKNPPNLMCLAFTNTLELLKNDIVFDDRKITKCIAFFLAKKELISKGKRDFFEATIDTVNLVDTEYVDSLYEYQFNERIKNSSSHVICSLFAVRLTIQDAKTTKKIDGILHKYDPAMKSLIEKYTNSD